MLATSTVDNPVSETSSVSDPFPELASERRRLAFSRACRDRMIERFSRVDPEAAADEITKEYVEVTVAEALDDLRTPGAGDFFGRIDEDAPAGHPRDRWYIGRRHIEDDAHDPVVVDWRAPIAAPFYRATVVNPLGLVHRRRFTFTDGELTAYLDEALDDPDADVASGIPDPVLAEIGAARTGAMREIVATIQAEQDVVIRAPADLTLIVQGGPGTGKTAVGLHRAAYLLFEHRRRLARDGVLVVGPNPVFLDYIADVLPSLGERSVQQRTVLDLCVPRVPVEGVDDLRAARAKGSPAALEALTTALRSVIRPPDDDVRVPIGARTLVFTRDEIAGWLDTATQGKSPLNKRRDGLRSIAQRELLRRTDRDGLWPQATALKQALDKAWPSQQPLKVVDRVLLELGHGPGGQRRRWTAADQLLADEANSLLNGPPFTFGHVVVDEAQDHSAVALRVIGRRSPSGSMTILGDLAQSTTPAGQDSWRAVLDHLGTVSASEDVSGVDGLAAQVAELTIGYRVPGPILEMANRLLPLTGVTTTASTSVRPDGTEPSLRLCSAADLAQVVADETVLVQHRHPSTGIVAPIEHHDAIADAVAARGLRVTGRVHNLERRDIAIFTPEAVKGLEFDGVIVVQPHEVLDGTARGARLLYVAMTRAVQVLHLVSTAALPSPLS